MDNLTIAAASGMRSRMESLDCWPIIWPTPLPRASSATRSFTASTPPPIPTTRSTAVPSETLPTVEKQWTDFSQGIIQVTGNPFDIALDGDGFFAVQGKNGTLYTRAGNLKVLPSGVLATSDGSPVLAPRRRDHSASP